MRHAAELTERDLTRITIDGAQAGVGGIDSWGSMPLPEHRIDPKAACSFAFVLVPIAEAEAAPELMAGRASQLAAAVRQSL